MEKWFAATPEQVREARHWVTASLERDGWGPDVLERAALITTELAANVLDHARSTQLGVALHAEGSTIRIEIMDCDPTGTVPTSQALDAASVRGRGLLIVDAMSSSWGVENAIDRKVVWAELRGDG